MIARTVSVFDDETESEMTTENDPKNYTEMRVRLNRRYRTNAPWPTIPLNHTNLIWRTSS